MIDDNFLVTAWQARSATAINYRVAITNYMSLYSQSAEKMCRLSFFVSYYIRIEEHMDVMRMFEIKRATSPWQG